jgi:hypothetical protein
MKAKYLGAAIAAALPVAVSGAVLIDEQPLGPQVVPFSGAVVNLAKFNLNPALLTKVTLSIDIDLSADLYAKNTSPSAVNVSAWIVGTVSADAPPVGLGGLDQVANFAGLVAGPVPLGPGDSTTFGGTQTANQVGSVSTVVPAEFLPYLGAGTFSVYFDGTGGWAFFGISNAEIEVSNFQASGTAKVTYEYIPEPHEYAVFAGLGLMGLAAFRRFKR